MPKHNQRWLCFGIYHYLSTMRITLTAILLSTFGSLSAQTQTDSIEVWGTVQDAFTGEPIEDGNIALLTPDSTFICNGDWGYNFNNGKKSATIISFKTGFREGRFLLKLTQKDYLTLYYPVHIRVSKRSTGFADIPGIIKMRKRPKNMRETNLGEAVISATKIKMVMKGDTIVYNADAFQLSKGSMLDALIEQLPGAQLKDNGVITVNGRPVSSLLVNGKEFFRGDPKVALDNLPAYMVDKVKVYEQETEWEKFTSFKETERPLVMDVNLKKQYSVGWIANAEAAYGTEDRYLGRIFAMRFTDCSRLALYGNVNNTNDTRRPGARGDWTPSYLPDGLQTARTAGGEYYYERRDKTFEWVSDWNAAHTDNHTARHTSSEQFLPTTKDYSLSRSDNHGHSVSAATSHRYKLEGKTTNQRGNASFSYNKNENRSWSFLGAFADDPYAFVTGDALNELFRAGSNGLLSVARYRRATEARSNGKSWNVGGQPYSLWWTPFKDRGVYDLILVDVNASYDKYTSNAFDRYDLKYFKATDQAEDYRNRYRNQASRHYNYGGTATYILSLKNVQQFITYGYTQDYRSGRNDLFRLDSLDGWGQGTEHPLGALPSANSALQDVLDLQNSEHSSRWTRTHHVALKWKYRSKNGGRTRIDLNLPLDVKVERLRYDRAARSFDLHRTKAVPGLNASFLQQFGNLKTMFTQFNVSYALSYGLPDISNRIDLINDSNPLYLQRGNPEIDPNIIHRVNFSLNSSKKWRRLYTLTLSYQRIHNAFANEQTYNPLTGGYSVRPVNVNGNWRTDGNFSIDRLFGKQKQFNWDNNTSYSFDHNVDMANVLGQTANTLSTVKSLYLREQFSVGYARKGWNLSAKVRGSYNRLTGNRSDFRNISAWDYSYGLTARIPLPGAIGLSTDFTVFSRRGYEDPSLNTDNFVWNVRLERSILNGNLTFILDGFDILHDLSSVTRTVNAQGRTESYTNVIPSYFMAHVIYKLNVQPKKKAR